MKNIGLIEVAYDDHMYLKISPYGNKVLFENKKIQLTTFNREFKVAEPKTKAKREPIPLTTQEVLFNKLKLLRRKLAVENNVPPYVIFTDASLHEMTMELPKNSDQFLAISGVGIQKLENYGRDFMDLIKTHLDDNRPKLTTYEETLLLLKENKSVEEIAQVRNMQSTTVFSHIAKLYQEGYPLEIENFVSKDEINRITQIVSEIGETVALKPIFEALNGEIEYGKIRLTLTILDRTEV
jgi:ATP-dependent DNA helicase RecQ